MDTEQRTQLLHQLADVLARCRLTTPARVFLDLVAPFGFLASQLALFTQPFVPHGRWRAYVAALSDEEGWALLQTIVERRDG